MTALLWKVMAWLLIAIGVLGGLTALVQAIGPVFKFAVAAAAVWLGWLILDVLKKRGV